MQFRDGHWTQLWSFGPIVASASGWVNRKSRFETALVAETASATGFSAGDVRLIVEQWIERRPLPYLQACRFPGLVELFAGLRRKGKLIGVLSDYPADAKLSALGLHADHVVCASDKGVGLLKPNPRGLQAMIQRPARTRVRRC